MRLYRVANSWTTPPPVDGAGKQWNDPAYTGTGGAGWQDAIQDTGTIYGKLIYDPCDGHRLLPLSWSSGGNAADNDQQTLYMRQPFGLTPMPTVPPTSFTITKSANPTSGITTNEVTYTLIICNTGQYTTSPVSVYDSFDPGFGFLGNWGGDCNGYGDGSPCISSSGSNFTATWIRGFPGLTCVTLTARVKDYYFDNSSDVCAYRSNVAGVEYPSPILWAQSNTVTVQMQCAPTNTFTNTFTPSYTYTKTNTYTQTFTPTQTNTFTQTFTLTNSQTFTSTFTPTITQTFSNTETPGGFTDTKTNTYTYTNTYTSTQTYTFTQTNTFSQTYTVTQTYSTTPTFTPTNTPMERITLQKSISKTEALIGDTLQYCITFNNVGSVVATFNIWDTIPAETDFLYCSGSVCSTYVNAGRTIVNWTITGLPPGGNGSVCFFVRVARFPVSANPFGNSYLQFAGTDEKYYIPGEYKAFSHNLPKKEGLQFAMNPLISP
jgi:uncharacterized repeat protein (TIGR01451 family)